MKPEQHSIDSAMSLGAAVGKLLDLKSRLEERVADLKKEIVYAENDLDLIKSQMARKQ